jgi:hypothetical protein
MEAVCPSEMLVSTYKKTRRHNPEDQHRQKYPELAAAAVQLLCGNIS